MYKKAVRLLLMLGLLLAVVGCAGVTSDPTVTPAPTRVPAYVPAERCGNGVLDAGEECDEGPMGNGPDSWCSSECQRQDLRERRRDTCFNGIIDAGEECDPSDVGGVNEVSVSSQGIFEFYDPLVDSWFRLTLARVDPPQLVGLVGFPYSTELEWKTGNLYAMTDDSGEFLWITVTDENSVIVSTADFPRLRLVIESDSS